MKTYLQKRNSGDVFDVFEDFFKPMFYDEQLDRAPARFYRFIELMRIKAFAPQTDYQHRAYVRMRSHRFKRPRRKFEIQPHLAASNGVTHRDGAGKKGGYALHRSVRTENGRNNGEIISYADCAVGAPITHKFHVITSKM